MKTTTYIELFAGAGGLAEGFIRAGLTPIVHIEVNKYASLTIKTRLSYHYLHEQGKDSIYYNYLRKSMTREDLYSLIPEKVLSSVINMKINKNTVDKIVKKINSNLLIYGLKGVDVIAGGPPCQAYSLVGRARDPYGMEKDPRNYLYKLYAEILKKIKPKVFVFENVPALLSAGNGKLWEDVRKHFSKAGYKTDFRILNAHDFGVLQKRLRIIVVGWRKEFDFSYPEFENDEDDTRYRVKDLLVDLPPVSPGERIEYGDYIAPSTEYLKKYGLRTKEDILTLQITRKHNARDRQIYKLAIKKWENERKRLKYTDIPVELRTHKNQKTFLDRFKVVAKDLPYSHTVLAHLAKDGHYFIHPDINQLRSISIREAARLQSFPDNYYFEGPMTEQFKQIGNAVPPLMAEKVAKKIKVMIS